MGQFSSSLYDGDPYIELIRSIPEREMIFWVQKIMWLAEGFTFLEHTARVYPKLFLHKCQHCNGAGTLICPSCSGFKIRRHLAGRISLSDKTLNQECFRCGSFCDWDHESEWEGKWNSWNKVLSYYDRSHGELYDEWYERMMNGGGEQEDDEPRTEVEVPPTDETGSDAELRRTVAKYPKRLEALLRRYGGHPYENDDMIPAGVVDPAKSGLENYMAMEDGHLDLPPELNPEIFPEFLLTDISPIRALDEEIRMETLIMQNLDCAMRNEPKPYMFEPTAGTIPCPNCQGTPYFYSMIPNFARILGIEEPLWMRTLRKQGQPRTMASRDHPLCLEYPIEDPLTAELQSMIKPSNGLHYPQKGFRNLDYQSFLRQKQSTGLTGPNWFDEFGTTIVSDCTGERSGTDRLSDEPMNAMDTEDLIQVIFGGGDGIQGGDVPERWLYSTPYKRLARRERDMRSVAALTGYEQADYVDQLSSKGAWAQQLNYPLEAQVHSSDYLDQPLWRVGANAD